MTHNTSFAFKKFDDYKEIQEGEARKYGVCHLCGPYDILERANAM